MRHQVIADEVDAGASPPLSSMKNKFPGCGRRVTPSAGDAVVEVEMVFPNGDLYSGEFAGNAPHGRGKCIWIDGCVYNGEWRDGNFSGKGKLWWPSGATYDGEFKDGKMEGYGSFIGANGETYQGSWIADRKHGYGKKSYANGDFYEGQWKRDVQDGQGRYVWRNRVQFVGEWRNGTMADRGVFILPNGDLHDGQLENGVPKRSGGFAWPDCSCYLGRWIRDFKSQQQMNGLSSSASLGSSKRSYVYRDFGRSGEGEDIPGNCGRKFDGETGDPACKIMDDIAASILCQVGSEFGEEEASASQLQRRCDCCSVPGDVKNHWPAILKGHKSYDLVLNLQLGIRYSVGKPSSKQSTKLWPSDFDPRQKFWTKFPVEGTKMTHPCHSSEFKWKDYCPKVFRHLRKLFSVDPSDYVKAICGTDSLRELSSPGKSGSLFFLTQDDRFIIKTVRKSEVKILIKMLLNYYKHVCKHENSLLTKFYGVHCVKPIGGHKVRFIVMGNLLCSEHGIHRRFDLKGSSYGRTIHKSEEAVDGTSTLKDLDLNFVFHLQKPLFKKFMWQIERDCEFLEAEGIMDYSLLVGFHFSDDLSASQKVSSLDGSFQGQGPLTEFVFPESGRGDTPREPVIRLGANMPARAEHVFQGSNIEQFTSVKSPAGDKFFKVVLYFGIIDILGDYNFTKKLEHAYKSLQVDPSSISAVDPKLYSRRFRDFIGRVFVKDGSEESDFCSGFTPAAAMAAT
ncbi:phosphatidylinositol 4-phosphate 5-kinase 1-like isoform X2 [Phalaenopsis equestris]|uniref:phosphatidylinositol 4-phosphate 5-kinase 1-like isoform X2 n=1 Tax=Phalaenopsis equestris TaxID=78828 RepID=UPI0009E3B7D3|nr:phosphatidylinositol 4-phosphate 5-kinase 1-like isoform X2 [Phalaenopsis equestris]